MKICPLHKYICVYIDHEMFKQVGLSTYTACVTGKMSSMLARSLQVYMLQILKNIPFIFIYNILFCLGTYFVFECKLWSGNCNVKLFISMSLGMRQTFVFSLCFVLFVVTFKCQFLFLFYMLCDIS